MNFKQYCESKGVQLAEESTRFSRPSRRYMVKASSYKNNLIKLDVSDGLWDKSDYAFINKDLSKFESSNKISDNSLFMSYSASAAQFVADAFAGIENELSKIVPGKAYSIWTKGVYGKPMALLNPSEDLNK